MNPMPCRQKELDCYPDLRKDLIRVPESGTGFLVDALYPTDKTKFLIKDGLPFHGYATDSEKMAFSLSLRL